MMKKLVGLLLAVTMLVFCASAWAATDLPSLIEANTIEAVYRLWPSTMQHVTYYDVNSGEATITADIYTLFDPEKGVSHTYLYSDGGAFVWANGGGYGRHGENNQLYVVGCIGDFYAQKIEAISAQNLGEFYDWQTIVSEETSPDGKLHLVLSGPLPEGSPYADDAATEQTLVARYVVDPATLIMESCDAFVQNGGGKERRYLSASLQRDPALVMPFDVTPLTAPQTTREIRVVIDPGTATKAEQVLHAPLNIVMYLYAPEGYSLYDDAACSVPMSSVAPDESGNYPESMTVYCKSK